MEVGERGDEQGREPETGGGDHGGGAAQQRGQGGGGGDCGAGHLCAALTAFHNLKNQIHWHFIFQPLVYARVAQLVSLRTLEIVRVAWNAFSSSMSERNTNWGESGVRRRLRLESNRSK